MNFPSQVSPDSAVDDLEPAQLLSSDDLFEILTGVWASYLHAGDELMPSSDAAVGPQVAGTVSVAGGWSGHVVVSVSAEAARFITTVLLEIPDEEITTEDIADAVGEMANVIGGNIKSLLPGPSTLGLPIVIATGDGSGISWPEASESMRIDLTWRNEAVAVTIWTATPTQS